MASRARSTRRRKAVLPTTTKNAILYTGKGVEAENSGSVNRQMLRLNPIMDHNPESYEDLKSDYCPLIFSSLERHLPINMFNAPRNNKFKYIDEILNKYLSPEELFRVWFDFFAPFHSFLTWCCWRILICCKLFSWCDVYLLGKWKKNKLNDGKYSVFIGGEVNCVPCVLNNIVKTESLIQVQPI